MKQSKLADEGSAGRLERDLRSAIVAGTLRPSMKLMSLRSVSKKYGITYARAQRVMKRLESQGFLNSHHGGGTYVADTIPSVESSRASNESADGNAIVIAPQMFWGQPESSWMTNIIRSFDEAMRDRGGSFRVLAEENLRDCLSSSERALPREWESAGIIFSMSGASEWLVPHLKQKAEAGAKVILLESDPANSDWALVVHVDGGAGIDEATKHAIELGHERIMFASWEVMPENPWHMWWRIDREEAFMEAMERGGLTGSITSVPFLPTLDDRLPLHERLGPELYGLMQMKRKRPTAVVCINDIVARVLIETCETLGIRVPDDLSVTGFDDEAWGVAQGLTTLSRPFREMSWLVAEVVHRMQSVPTLRCKGSLAVAPVLVERRSVAHQG